MKGPGCGEKRDAADRRIRTRLAAQSCATFVRDLASRVFQGLRRVQIVEADVACSARLCRRDIRRRIADIEGREHERRRLEMLRAGIERCAASRVTSSAKIGIGLSAFCG